VSAKFEIGDEVEYTGLSTPVMGFITGVFGQDFLWVEAVSGPDWWVAPMICHIDDLVLIKKGGRRKPQVAHNDVDAFLDKQRDDNLRRIFC